MILLNELIPVVEKTYLPKQEHLGSLTTTFLLAMANPIINLPIERIERQLSTNRDGYADDSNLDPQLSDAISYVLGGRELQQAPFFNRGVCSFSKWKEPFNIADQLPDQLARELQSDAAFRKASTMAASQWSSCLRNALAHGGITYLTADGLQAFDAQASMYAFVSGVYENDDKARLIALNVLRIREVDFLLFLRGWVKWLEESGISESLAA